jgi:hypothetical protein
MSSKHNDAAASVIGIDIGKNSFHVVGQDQVTPGKAHREQMLSAFAGSGRGSRNTQRCLGYGRRGNGAAAEGSAAAPTCESAPGR